MIYYALAGLLNNTIITITPHQISVKHGPLPYFGNKRLESQNVKQFYIKEKSQKNNKSTTYTYEVHIEEVTGSHKRLVKGFDSPLQALYLEQELEQYLDIEDQPVTGEFRRPRRQSQQMIWQTMAQANGLSFTPSKLPEAMHITGQYHKYDLSLTVFRKHNQRDGPYHTHLILSTDTPTITEKYPTPRNVVFLMNRLNEALAAEIKVKVAGDGQKIDYEQFGIETKAQYLQYLFDSFRYLLDAYPYMAELGGEAIVAFQPIAADNKHPLRSLTGQWIEEIARTTHRLQHQTARLRCQLCLVHFTAHEVKLSWLNHIVYFGCEACHQSRDFYSADRVVAVLDSQTKRDAVQQDQTLRVNWFSHKELFYFDAVEVIHATDEEVERFAVAVGNDTNPTRKSQYKTMSCTISTECVLSQNSIRVLQHTFGTVEIISF